jgi:hypothetical protein
MLETCAKCLTYCFEDELTASFATGRYMGVTLKLSVAVSQYISIAVLTRREVQSYAYGMGEDQGPLL